MAPKKQAKSGDKAPLLPEGPTSGSLDPQLFSEKNMCGCTRRNFFRRMVGGLVTSAAFDGLILLVIIANCVMMASSSPLEESPAYFEQVEFVFNCIFLAEMWLKIIAYGFSDYLKDGWNLLDVVVVTTAWLPYVFPGMGNYSAIRAVRVLRALRTVNRIPSLKKIINTLISAIPEVRCHTESRTHTHARARAPPPPLQMSSQRDAPACSCSCSSCRLQLLQHAAPHGCAGCNCGRHAAAGPLARAHKRRRRRCAQAACSPLRRLSPIPLVCVCRALSMCAAE